ncbi:MAG: hypothetical protein M3066_07185 [Actinomycetota bacterium]|nr:hypothetical protein [Actinomycetota bacterium]
MRSTYLRPGAWLPVVALIGLAGFLAEVVRPWPEGRILYTPRGLGPHGITAADVIVLAVVVVAAVVWLSCWGRTDGFSSDRRDR